MTYKRELLNAAHSSRHREEVAGSAACGCFACLETFEPAEIEHWLLEGSGTALRPRCAVDSVLGAASGYR